MLDLPITNSTNAQARVAAIFKSGVDAFTPFVLMSSNAAGQHDWSTNWIELTNKTEIFDLVANVNSRLPATITRTLSARVTSARRLGEFASLWAIEGLGNEVINAQLANNNELDSTTFNLPQLRRSLTMLNAGLGLAVARHLFELLSSRSSQFQAEDLVRRFESICQREASPGYVGCAMESLGLVAGAFFPKRVASVDSAIVRAGNDALLGFFWHGVGRSSYFILQNFLPCLGISWLRLVEQSSHEIGKTNLVSGLAWAINLVNMRNPDVMSKLIRERGKEIRQVGADAFANGVISSTLVRNDVTPNASFVHRYCQQLEPLKEFGLDCNHAGENFHPAPVEQDRLGELFRYSA